MQIFLEPLVDKIQLPLELTQHCSSTCASQLKTGPAYGHAENTLYQLCAGRTEAPREYGEMSRYPESTPMRALPFLDGAHNSAATSKAKEYDDHH